MITAQNQRHLARLQSFQHQVSLLCAGRSDLLQILGVRIAFFFLLGDCDGYIPCVLDNVPQLFKPGLETGNANSGWPHINAAAGLAQVERHTNDADFLRRNIRSGYVSCHGLAD